MWERVLSPDHAQILYCSNEIIRRALRTARATRKAGAPSVGLLNVPYSTFAGASDPQAGAPALVRAALSSLRHENLYIIRARFFGMALKDLK